MQDPLGPVFVFGPNAFRSGFARAKRGKKTGLRFSFDSTSEGRSSPQGNRSIIGYPFFLDCILYFRKSDYGSISAYLRFLTHIPCGGNINRDARRWGPMGAGVGMGVLAWRAEGPSVPIRVGRDQATLGPTF